MNKKPMVYRQIDPRWKNLPYRVPGENATIGGSGCGPTCAAMLIETLTGKTYTPVDACKWSVDHGYKALGQGTYYAYFRPQFAAFGIDCDQLNWVNTYGKPDSANHEKAFDLLRQGYYLIALMGKGRWTSSGHFVVVWWEDGKVRINDPASTNSARLNGDLRTFKSQVKYYWWVDARKFNNEEDEDMTQEQFNKMFTEAMKAYEAERAKAVAEEEAQPAASWAKDSWDKATTAGVFDGTRPKGALTREQAAVVLDRVGVIK